MRIKTIIACGFIFAGSLFGQNVNVQKAQVTNVLTGDIVVGTGHTISTSGSGAINATGGANPVFSGQITTPKIVFTTSVADFYGTGDPEGVISAAVSSTFRRTDGGTATSLYVKETGTTGNTGWVAVGGGGGSGTVTHTGSLTVNQVVVGNATADIKILAAGTNGNVLTMVSGAPAWGAAGVGGTTGSTDNALLRADGTGGATVQSSTATLSDSGILTTAGVTIGSSGGTVTGSSGNLILSAVGSSKNVSLVPGSSGTVIIGDSSQSIYADFKASAGGQGFFRFYDNTTETWDFGKQTDNSFILYDAVGSAYALSVSTGASSGQFYIQKTTASSSTTTGALRVDGGAGFAGNLNVGGSVTPSQAGGIVGTTANNNASAGSVGEYTESLVAVGSPVSLTTSTAANITSISLGAGDWDISGNVNFSASTATVTGTAGGISSTSATLPTDGTEVYSGVQVTLLSETDSVTVPSRRFSLSTTTTIYLVGKSTFSAGSVGGFGSLSARRRR